MTGNHWTIFNSGGAVVADNMPLAVVRAYLTPERFVRGWMAAYCITVRTEEELAALGPDTEDPHTYGEDCDECEGYCLRFPSWSKAQPLIKRTAPGSPARQGAEPDGQDLNPVSVKDLSASASPATKEQQC